MTNRTYPALLGGAMLIAFNAHALTYTWEGDVSTSWSNAGNWDLNSGEPNRDDDVIFDTPGTFDPDITGTKEEALTLTFNQAGNSISTPARPWHRVRMA